MGQYVENESLMYEPCVRNRRVAPREDRYSLKRQIFFFNILRKKRKKIEKKSNEGQNEYFLILENLCLRILFNNTIVDCRYSLIVSIYCGCNGSDEFFDDPATPQLLNSWFSPFCTVDYRLRFQESSIIFREIVSIIFFFFVNLFYR